MEVFYESRIYKEYERRYAAEKNQMSTAALQARWCAGVRDPGG